MLLAEKKELDDQLANLEQDITNLKMGIIQFDLIICVLLLELASQIPAFLWLARTSKLLELSFVYFWKCLYFSGSFFADRGLFR